MFTYNINLYSYEFSITAIFIKYYTAMQLLQKAFLQIY